ncbi:MAG TPA: DNA-3-methyladenine glycosylase [Acidimicrobiales bacterium]|jgi:DNA-3-methyladenine glycosylase|nr:DNA-3-methyladenine glycosylase [Acidimicrobiales bacterium]
MRETTAKVVARSFYAADSLEVAPRLLGKLLVRADGRAGRIIEVEAYRGGDDPGSHAFRGRTARNATMFGPPGHLYVYFTYGMHWCANVVCGDEGVAHAVLLRALEPVAGLTAMRIVRARPAPKATSTARLAGEATSTAGRSRAAVEGDLCRGPGRLCQALGIDRSHDGADLVAPDRGVWVADDGTPPPSTPGVTTRIGLTAGADRPWRWLVEGHPGLSRGPRGPRGRRAGE